MKHNIIFFLISLTAQAILLSCGNYSTEPEVNQNEYQFLTDTRNHWTYSFYDSLSSKSDTVVITPISTTLYDNRQPTFIWQLKFKSNVCFVSKISL